MRLLRRFGGVDQHGQTRAWSLAHVKIEIDGRRLRITVSDDGIGGADPDRGSGLVGINDRVQRWAERFLYPATSAAGPEQL